MQLGTSSCTEIEKGVGLPQVIDLLAGENHPGHPLLSDVTHMTKSQQQDIFNLFDDDDDYYYLGFFYFVFFKGYFIAPLKLPFPNTDECLDRQI